MGNFSIWSTIYNRNKLLKRTIKANMYNVTIHKFSQSGSHDESGCLETVHLKREKNMLFTDTN